MARILHQAQEERLARRRRNQGLEQGAAVHGEGGVDGVAGQVHHLLQRPRQLDLDVHVHAAVHVQHRVAEQVRLVRPEQPAEHGHVVGKVLPQERF